MDRISNEIDDKFDGKQVKETAKFINEYLEDVFLEGFIIWLNKECKYIEILLELEEEKIVCKVENNKNTEYNELIREKIKPKLDIELEKLEENEKTIRLYLFLSMVDNKGINEFSNELIKYRQFTEKKLEKENIFFLGLNIEIYLVLCEFILLTRERLDSKKDEKNQKLFERLYGTGNNQGNILYNKLLERFIEKEVFIDNSQISIYYQENKTTPVLHSTLENTRKYSTQDFLSKCKLSKCSKKIHNDELEEIKKEIVNVQDKKNEFHDLWKKCKKNNLDLKKDEFISKNEESYIEYYKNCEKIRKYNYLKNMQTLQNIYNYHKIILEIQSRNIAFINKYERDFKFLMIAIHHFSTNDIVKNKLLNF